MALSILVNDMDFWQTEICFWIFNGNLILIQLFLSVHMIFVTYANDRYKLLTDKHRFDKQHLNIMFSVLVFGFMFRC